MPEKPANPWKTFLSTAGLGVVAIAGGIYLYFDLANWEQTGGTRLMNSTISFFYHIMGKTGVLAVCLLAGVVLIAFGLLDLRKQLKQRHETATDNSPSNTPK